MVSRNGVDPPLAGGPHRPGVKPSCAWISRALKAPVKCQRAHDESIRVDAYRFE